MHSVDIYELNCSTARSAATDCITDCIKENEHGACIYNDSNKPKQLTTEHADDILQQIARLDTEIFPGNIWGIESYRKCIDNEYDYLTAAINNYNSDEVKHVVVTNSDNSVNSNPDNNAVSDIDNDKERSCSKLAGFALLRCFDDAELIRIAVDTKQRRHGIGERLLDNLLQEARTREIHNIFLEVRSSNVPAIRLYEKAGFINAGIRKGYYSNPTEDAIIMRYTW